MKRILIGHRGVGKSQLLKRHQEYLPYIFCFDLDVEVEKQTQQKIRDIFQNQGEAAFRKLEKEVFYKLIQDNNSYVISLGAGFDLSALPNDAEVIFVSRRTDQDGRIFLNRPRLAPEFGPLDEYKIKYQERQEKYLKSAHRIYHMPEGVESSNEIEKQILTSNFKLDNAYYTLTEKDLFQIEVLIAVYSKIELRTDLLKSETIHNLIQKYPKVDWLVSIRTDESLYAPLIDADIQFDYQNAQIVSSHAGNIEEGIAQLAAIKGKKHLKLSVVVESFVDLVKGHRWQQQDPQNRSFLPRSQSGKWLWFRQLSSYWQKLNFVRNFTDMPDQPSLYEFLVLPNEKPREWGSVLGKPVHHSRSPIEHQSSIQVFTRIEMSPEEFTEYFDFLKELGLSYAAVTSPLKEKAFEIAKSRTQEANNLKSANTIFVKNNQIYSHNTDLVGFQNLVESIKPTEKVAIWGGGGTLQMMKTVLPQAYCYSSQTAKLRDIKQTELKSYDYLIWAAPRTENTQFPGQNLQFKTLIDLNYTENSMGLEYAALRNIQYVSGLEMFKAQAQAQRKFWGIES